MARRRIPLERNDYRDPDDAPCKPGHGSLWPGGPALPFWAEYEMSDHGVVSIYNEAPRARTKRLYSSPSHGSILRKEA